MVANTSVLDGGELVSKIGEVEEVESKEVDVIQVARTRFLYNELLAIF